MATGEKYNYLIGTKINLLTILGEFISKGKQIHTKVKCDCGVVKYSPLPNILKGVATSCGCFRKEVSRKMLTTHGQYDCPEYNAWKNIKKRCYDKTNKNYANYGGRGISMYSKWINNFPLFLKDVGKKPSKKHSLDRKDVNGNYTPKNCRWVTQQVQCNNKRGNRIIIFRDKNYTVADFAREIKMNYFTVHHRLDNGWSIEEIINTPVASNFRGRYNI